MLLQSPCSIPSMPPLEVAAVLAIPTYYYSCRFVFPWLPMALYGVQRCQWGPKDRNLEIHSAPVDVLHFFCSKILFGEDFHECNVTFPSSERFPCSRGFYCGFTLLQESPALRDPVRCKDILFVLVKVTAQYFFSMPHSSCVSSIRIRYNVPDVSSLLKSPRIYFSCPYPYAATKWATPNPSYFVVPNTTSLFMFRLIPIFWRIAFTGGFWISLHSSIHIDVAAVPYPMLAM
jgi:hypothetical protein